MLRAQTKALDGDQSLDLRCTGVVERNPEAFCARRSLIGLLCGPAFSASFESPSGRHHQSFQRPFRHARETPTRPELPPAPLGRQDAAACQDAFACTSSAPKLRQSQNWTPIDARRSWLLGASPLGNGRSSQGTPQLIGAQRRARRDVGMRGPWTGCLKNKVRPTNSSSRVGYPHTGTRIRRA